MKKILLILLLLFTPLLVNGSETANVWLEYVPNVYWNYRKNGLVYWGQFAYIHVDDKIGYCLDVKTPVNTSTYYKSSEAADSVLRGKAYFGYGYNGNNTLKDYMATQKIIWDSKNNVEIYFTTQSGGNGSIISVQIEFDEITQRFNSHRTAPSYSNMNFNIDSINYVVSPNQVTTKFEVVNNTKNQISIDENHTITFVAKEIGGNIFALKKTFEYRSDNVIYTANNSQKIMVAGNIEGVTRYYRYDVFGGEININVEFDEDLGKTKEDNTFEIYDKDNEKIGTYNTTPEGSLKIKDLYPGTYTIKQIKETEGYKSKTKEYKIEITKDYLNKNQNILLNAIKGEININVEFDEDLGKTKEDNTFEIYDKDNEKIGTYNTTPEGSLKIKDLYPGTYTIKQIKETEGYKSKTKEYKIEITKDYLNKNQNILLNAIKGEININVEFDEDLGKTKEDNTFEIYDKDNEKIGTYNTTKEGSLKIKDLYPGIYTIKQIKETEGYKSKTKEYKIEITKDNLNKHQNILLNVIYIDIIINKTYTNVLLEDLNMDSDIIYEIYDKNDKLVNKMITNNNGVAKNTLKYGYYVIKQTNVNNIDFIHDDIIIDETMFNSPITKNIHDNIFKFDIRINFIDQKNNELIKDVVFEINDEEFKTNNGIFILKDKNFGIYKINDIYSEKYNQIDTILYDININSEFNIENDIAYYDIDVYLEEIKKEENIFDEINEDKINDNIEDKEEDKINDNIEDKEEDKINDNIEDNINDEIIDKVPVVKIEKLPFLGEYGKKYEKIKYIVFAMSIGIFKWLQKVH